MSVSKPQQIARVTINLPPFWTKDVSLWFARVEAQFENDNVTAEKTKFNYIVSALEYDILQAVRDIVITPPSHNPYVALKNRLLEHYKESDIVKSQQLLKDVCLGDRKPSHLSNQMKQLRENKITDNFLRALRLRRSPVLVESIVAEMKMSLDKLASQADKIVELVGSENKITDNFLRALWLRRLPVLVESIEAEMKKSLDKLASQADKIVELVGSGSAVSAVTIPQALSNIQLSLQEQISSLATQIEHISAHIASL